MLRFDNAIHDCCFVFDDDERGDYKDSDVTHTYAMTQAINNDDEDEDEYDDDDAGDDDDDDGDSSHNVAISMLMKIITLSYCFFLCSLCSDYKQGDDTQ